MRPQSARINSSFLLLSALAACLAATVWLACRRVHQSALNEALVAAAIEGDAAHARRLLADGADPSVWIAVGPQRRSGFLGLWDVLFDRTPRGPGVRVCALGCSLSCLHDAPWTRRGGRLKSTANPLELTKLLVDCSSISLNGRHLRDAQQRSPLMIAIRDGDADLVRRMLEHGADVNARDWIECTPLSHAAMVGNADEVAMLLQHGADPNADDEVGRTVLQYALGSLHRPVVVGALLRAGADPNRPCQFGTPLIFAARFCRPDIVRLLLQRGARPADRDRRGRTALDVAKRFSRTENAAILARALAQHRARR